MTNKPVLMLAALVTNNQNCLFLTIEQKKKINFQNCSQITTFFHVIHSLNISKISKKTPKISSFHFFSTIWNTAGRYKWCCMQLQICLSFTVNRGGSMTAATSKMEHFVIIVSGFQPLTIITERNILDVAAVLDPPLVKSTTK